MNFVEVPLSRSPTPSLWRVPFLGGTPARLMDDVWSAAGWSADGTRMAFLRVRGADEVALIVAGSDGAGERVLASRKAPHGFYTFSAGEPDMPPAWSPDGTRMAVLGYQSRGDDTHSDVAIIDTRTGGERTLSLGRIGVSSIAWLDTEWLVLSAAEAGAPGALWRVSATSGTRSRLTNDLSTFTTIDLMADRNTLVTSRQETQRSIWMGDETGRSGAEVVPPAIDRSALFGGLTWLNDRLLFVQARRRRRPSSRSFPARGIQSLSRRDTRRRERPTVKPWSSCGMCSTACGAPTPTVSIPAG